MLEEQEGGPLTNKIAMVVPGGKKPVECFFALWTKSNGNKIYYFISGSKNKTLRPNLIWTNVLKDEIVSIWNNIDYFDFNGNELQGNNQKHKKAIKDDFILAVTWYKQSSRIKPEELEKVQEIYGI